MAYYVQVYRSTDLNSPPITGQAGGLLSCLNPCLVDGYGWSGMSISSLTRAGAVATATVSAADGLKLKTGMILTISGVTGPGGGDPALYNGTFTITVASTTTFTYTMSGTPSGTATGTIVVSSWLPITSITRGGAGNLTATLTMNNQNVTLITGNYITVTGCTSTGAAQYNGTFRITVTSSTTFTYQMVSDPGASATVTGATYYKAGLQWTRPFSAGTNSQTYKSATTVGALGETYVPRPLQIIDNAATAGLGLEAQMYSAEIMQADQIVTFNQFPTVAQKASGLCMRKSVAASSAVKEWTLWGDEKTFTLNIFTTDVNTFNPAVAFGYFIPTKSGDLFNTFISGGSSFNVNNASYGINTAGWLANTAAASNFYISRSYTQIGTSLSTSLCYSSTGTVNSILGAAAASPLLGPNPTDSGYYVQPVFVQDVVGTLRGRMPGLYGLLNPITNFSNFDTITNVVGMSGSTLMFHPVGSVNIQGGCFIDMFGPWI